MNRPSADINDVFRSIAGDTPEPAGSGWAFFGVIFAISATCAAILLVRRYVVYRKTMAYQRHRMERSIARELDLTREQHRDLKRFAKQRGVSTPLTLLLCPSLLKR
ncbi:MAG: PGF-CTERM sorting domain-containing protein, partial [Planctomycetota bacterium]